MFFGIAYIIDFIINLSNRLSQFLKIIVYLLLIIFTGIDIYCLFKYHTRINPNFLEIIAATNPAEAKEYLQMYVGWKEYVASFMFFVGSMALFIWANKIKLGFKIAPSILFLLLSGSIFAGLYNPALKREYDLWNLNFDDVVDLRNYLNNPSLVFNYDSLPDNVVIIIGESHSPRHSSLYGYSLATNPKLERRKEENFKIFHNVKSPATHTSEAFKYILNTRLIGSNDSLPWYKSTHLIEILNKAGYTTYWFSNQARQGLYNNLSSAAADLCDSVVFLRKSSEDKIYDAQLTEINLPDKKSAKNAVFYHIMGQHVLFYKRYPQNFNIFVADNYPKSIEIEKRETLASYDNATLYNDFVTDEIIKKYEDSDAVVFYFSDHGLDIFESQEDYCGHAINSPESISIGTDIPFYIFISDQFKEKHPSLADRFLKAKSNGFSTDKFIFTVMDLCRISFCDNDYVNQYSLLNN